MVDIKSHATLYNTGSLSSRDAMRSYTQCKTSCPTESLALHRLAYLQILY